MIKYVAIVENILTFVMVKDGDGHILKKVLCYQVQYGSVMNVLKGKEMKLRNKKTGEIRKCRIFNGHFQMWVEVLNDWVDYGDIDYLAKYWERYEEPKYSYYLTAWGEVKEYSKEGFNINHKLEIGNYFRTKEEAEEAVEKLKAWRRLRDSGCEFNGYIQEGDTISIELLKGDDFSFDDIDLLFGGEE